MARPPQRSPVSAESAYTTSENTPSPAEDNFNHGTTTDLPQGSEARKRKFGTVDPPRPTAAKRRVPDFVDGYYAKDSWSGSSKLKRLVKKAMETYSYDDCPLEEGHIRLLFLKPSDNPEDNIILELRSYPIDEIINHPDECRFTALSYNWGEGSESKIVFMDKGADTDPASVPKINIHDVPLGFKRRMKTLHVRPNLYAFLEQFRHRKREVALWVDRVCINQTSNVEKQDQVSRMGIIYSIAANVSIWLGPADQDEKTDRAMDFIGSILQGPLEEKFEGKYATHWSELLLLMRRRWFSRRWIIQELALSKNSEVRCGSKRVHWRDFSDAVSIFALHFDDILKIIKRRPDLVKSLEGIKDMNPFGARILVDVLSNTFQRHIDGTIYTPRQGLESLISSLSIFETSDPRDTVYTLLNLAKESCKLPTPGLAPTDRKGKFKENQPPVPNYNMDLLEVYTHFLKWCIKESGSLDILCRHWALPEVKQKLDDFYPKTVILPSWITTVRDSAYGSQAEGFGGRRTGDSFVGTPETRCYNASPGLTPTVSFGRDQRASPGGMPSPAASVPLSSGKAGASIQPAQQDLSRLITIKGCCIGRITERHQMHEGIIPKTVLKCLGHDGEIPEIETVPDTVWRTLVADRGPDGKPPPAWYHRACMNCLVADTNAGNIDTNAILQQGDTTNLQSAYLKRVQAVCWNRAFIGCSDEKRLVGVGPVNSEQDDMVCILYGCSVPCILRQSLHGTDPYYLFIGEAFILGQMDGEAIMDLPAEELENVSTDFTIM